MLAVPWMTHAFVGILDVQEVLHLWDRILGFDSLLLLPVVAVGILAWRSKKLKRCIDKAEAMASLKDLSQLRVVPLLQAVLFLSPIRSRNQEMHENN
jgi:hypothetical protein